MFDGIFDAIEEWMRELLTGMIHSNLDRMFTDSTGVEWQHFQHDTKSVEFGHHADSRNYHYFRTLL